MARDEDGIVEDKWASATGADISTPTDFSVVETDGFPASWSQASGQALPRRLWNWFLAAHELRSCG